MEYHKFSCPFQLNNLENGYKHFHVISFAAEPDPWRVRPGMLPPLPSTTTPTRCLPFPFRPSFPSLPLSPPSLHLPSIALLSIFLPPLPPFPAAKLGGLGKSAPSRLHGGAPVAKTFRIHFEPKKIVSGSNDFSFFSAEQYIHGSKKLHMVLYH